MLKKLVSIFILISFSFLAQSETGANFSNKTEQQLTKSSLKVSNPSLLDFDCGDCDSNGCSHKDTHCAHHCSGLHNIALDENSTVLPIPTGLDTKALWYLNNHYTKPFLDPALKPPMHS